jgi:alcohol dehydrogenase
MGAAHDFPEDRPFRRRGPRARRRLTYLLAYAAADLNAKAAAEQLLIHVNTAHHRLSRIRDRLRSAAPQTSSAGWSAIAATASAGRGLRHIALEDVQVSPTNRRAVDPYDDVGRIDERVLLSCVSSCGRCRFCKEGRYGQCLGGGGWIFGHLIDGLQAEYARVPFADNSVYKVPDELSDEQVLFLADILPTSYEVGVLNGMVAPGDVVAIVGAGPIGLAAILTATLYTPGRIIAIDLADSRLESALRFGADATINNAREDAYARVMELTEGLGADVAFEAVGVPQTFELATELIRPCGRVANIGVHGEPVTLHLETLWTRDVTITTGLVDTYTIPRLLKLVASGRLDPTIFATHRFALGETMSAYDTFADAATTNALKVVLEGGPRDLSSNGHIDAGVVAGAVRNQ